MTSTHRRLHATEPAEPIWSSDPAGPDYPNTGASAAPHRCGRDSDRGRGHDPDRGIGSSASSVLHPVSPLHRYCCHRCEAGDGVGVVVAEGADGAALLVLIPRKWPGCEVLAMVEGGAIHRN